MHCVGQFTWCWSLWEKGDHPSHYFISSLTLSHRCTLAHTPARTHTKRARTHTHRHHYLSLPVLRSLPLFCGPVLSWLLFQTAAASVKKKNSKPCRVVQTVTSREGFFILNTTVVYFKNATASGFGVSHGRV